MRWNRTRLRRNFARPSAVSISCLLYSCTYTTSPPQPICNACLSSWGWQCGSTLIPALCERAQAPGSGVQAFGSSEQCQNSVVPTWTTPNCSRYWSKDCSVVKKSKEACLSTCVALCRHLFPDTRSCTTARGQRPQSSKFSVQTRGLTD